MLSSGTSGPGAGPNTSRIVINVIDEYMNKAKGITPSFAQSMTYNSHLYPAAAPASIVSTNPGWFPNYTGSIVWKFTGQAALGVTAPLLVSSGTKYVSGITMTGTDTGEISGGGVAGSPIYNPTNDATARVVFQQGFSVQGMSAGASNGAGGNLIRVTVRSGFLAAYGNFTGLVVAAQTGQGAATGTWNATKIDNSNFDLVGTTWNASDPWISGGTCLFATNLTTILFLTSGFGTYNNFDNWVICKAAHEADCDAGLYWDPDYVAQHIDLNNNNNPGKYSGILRFMDVSQVQGSFESYYALRTLPTDQSWSLQPPGIQVGTITNTADAFTCSNPSNSPASGPPSDGEVLQGFPTTTNATVGPTLGITGRAGTTFPICMGTVIFPHSISPRLMALSGGAVSAAQTMTFTFTASWLSGLPGVVGTTYTLTIRRFRST